MPGDVAWYPKAGKRRWKQMPSLGVEPPASGTDDDGVLDTDYSFYDVLPTQETVDVPAAEASASERRPMQRTASRRRPGEPGRLTHPPQKPNGLKFRQRRLPHLLPSPKPERYLLQAGAFRAQCRCR